jgi:hypothetical protein
VSLSELLQNIVDILDDLSVPYMLTGSLAAAYYATPRATKDIDIVFEADQAGVDQLVKRLKAAGLYVDREAALDALRSRTQFNAIAPTTGWKIDFIVRKERPFSHVEFERRESASILGIEASLASLEDVLIAKLEWSSLGDSELQRRDVIELLERAGSRIDLVYVNRWIRELGLETEWSTSRRKAGLESPGESD